MVLVGRIVWISTSGEKFSQRWLCKFFVVVVPSPNSVAMVEDGIKSKRIQKSRGRRGLEQPATSSIQSSGLGAR